MYQKDDQTQLALREADSWKENADRAMKDNDDM